MNKIQFKVTEQEYLDFKSGKTNHLFSNKLYQEEIIEFREIKDLLPEGECRDMDNHRDYQHLNESGNAPGIAYCRKCNWDNDVFKIYGTAKIEPIAVNPYITKTHFVPVHNSYTFCDCMEETSYYDITEEQYNKVKENHIDKGENFIAHEISGVKDYE